MQRLGKVILLILIVMYTEVVGYVLRRDCIGLFELTCLWVLPADIRYWHSDGVAFSAGTDYSTVIVSC